MARAHLKSLLYALLFRTRIERDMDAEWQFHIDARVNDLIASGMSLDDATARARRDFGDPLRWREPGREVRGVRLFDELRRDVVCGLRQFRRTPVFAGIIVTTVALGVGANTALFSLVNSLVIRKLPVQAPDRLTVVTGGIPTYPFVPQLPGYTYQIWKAFEARATAFEGVAVWAPARLDLSRRGEVEPVDGVVVSGGFSLRSESRRCSVARCRPMTTPPAG